MPSWFCFRGCRFLHTHAFTVRALNVLVRLALVHLLSVLVVCTASLWWSLDVSGCAGKAKFSALFSSVFMICTALHHCGEAYFSALAERARGRHRIVVVAVAVSQHTHTHLFVRATRSVQPCGTQIARKCGA